MRTRIFNKVGLAVMIAASHLPAFAQSEMPDTVKIIQRADIVTISSEGNTTKLIALTKDKAWDNEYSYEVEVTDKAANSPEDWDFDFPFNLAARSNQTVSSSSRRLQRQYCLSNIFFGQRFNYFDKGHVKNSFECGIRNLVSLAWSHGPGTTAFSIGIGFSLQKYNAEDGFIYSKEGDRLILMPIEEGYARKQSSLQVFSVQVPFMITQPIGKCVELALGAIAKFNSFAAATTVCSKAHNSYKFNFTGLQQRLMTPELVAAIGIADIGLYASWSPVSIFSDPYGPKLKSWSLGVNLGF